MIRTNRSQSLQAALAVTFALSLACGGSSTKPPPPTLQSIVASPSPVTLEVAGTQQLSVKGTYSDGSTAAIATGLTWATSKAAVATVSAAGLVTAVAVGTASVTVTETASGRSATVPVTVNDTLASIAVGPKTISKPVGATQQLTVTGTYVNATTAPLTSGLNFVSDHTNVATVTANGGLVTAVAVGTATITVTETASGKTDTAAVTVTAATLTSVAITPAGPLTLYFAAGLAGDTQQLAAAGTYSDGSHHNVGNSLVTWHSSVAAATVDGTGLVTAAGGGSATITATVGTLPAASATVNVTAQHLASLSATPITKVILVGASYPLSVTGSYDAGPTRDVTNIATYTPGDTNVVIVDSHGSVTGHASGVTTVDVNIGAIHANPVPAVTVNTPAGQIFFAGAYATNVGFVGFTDPAQANDVSIDAATSYNGHASFKVNFPVAGKFTGGAFVSSVPPDLRAYTAVTFWAKASAALTLEKVGLGNNAGVTTNPGHEAELVGIGIPPLTTAWQKFTLPIPDPSKLNAIEGLFHFADGTNHTGTFWLADIQYEAVTGLAFVPSWLTTSLTVPQGSTYQVTTSDLTVDFTNSGAGALPSSGTLTTVNANYFSYTSDSAAVTASATGLITAVSTGTASSGNITAKLGTVPTGNVLAITTPLPLASPGVPPAPAATAGASVVSLWSSLTPGGLNGTASDYSSHINFHEFQGSEPLTGNTFPIAGTPSAAPRKYTLLAGAGSYAGIGWDANPINASLLGVDTLHVDVWTPDFATVTGAVLKFQLVDFASGGPIVNTAQIFPSAASSPPLSNGAWLSYNLNLASDFGYASLPTKLEQMTIIAASASVGGTIYVDNLYLYKAPPPPGPTAPNPAPTALKANVISLFSSTYTGGTANGDYSGKVDSYNATCFGSSGTLTYPDYTIQPAGTYALKRYAASSGFFAIIETIGATGGAAVKPDSALCNAANRGTQTGSTLDISAMTALHFDVWSPGGSTNFQVHLLNGDSNGQTNQGPGAPGTAGSGTNVATGAKTVAAGAWVHFDLPFATEFGGTPSTFTKLALVKFFSSDAGVFYIDNLYFDKPGAVAAGAFRTITFDDAAVTYSLTGFGGAEDSTVVADPDNAANKVAKVNRSATAAVWAGTTVSTGAGASVPPIPFTATKKKMTVRVRSPLAAGTHVRLKVEDHTNGAISCETEALTTRVNAWEALTFDFASPAGAALDLSKTYDKVSIFFDFGVDGPTAGAQTFYFDDVAFPSFDPITFDDVAVTYTLTGFGGAEDSTVATDPDGVHTSNHVAKVNRSATAAVWAGTTVSTGAGASVPRVPFTLGETRMTVRVYSPTAAGTHVRLKVEDHTNGAITCETEALTTQVNGWETLTFNFANAAGAALDLSKTYDKVSIFFDFGVDGATAGARTYYFDDVSFVP